MSLSKKEALSLAWLLKNLSWSVELLTRILTINLISRSHAKLIFRQFGDSPPLGHHIFVVLFFELDFHGVVLHPTSASD